MGPPVVGSRVQLSCTSKQVHQKVGSMLEEDRSMVVSAPTALAPRRHRGRHGNWQDARTARAPQRRPDLQNPIRQCKCSSAAELAVVSVIAASELVAKEARKVIPCILEPAPPLSLPHSLLSSTTLTSTSPPQSTDDFFGTDSGGAGRPRHPAPLRERPQLARPVAPTVPGALEWAAGACGCRPRGVLAPGARRLWRHRGGAERALRHGRCTASASTTTGVGGAAWPHSF